MSKSQKQRPTRIEAFVFRGKSDPVFIQAVDHAANLKLFSAIKSGRLRVVRPPKSQTTARYAPRLDIIDDPSSSNYLAVFELPGMSVNEIQISIGDGSFTVHGERKPRYPIYPPPPPDDPNLAPNELPGDMDVDEEGDAQRPSTKVLVQELCFGTFSRTVSIPKGVKGNEVKANLREGMLIVTYPKQATQAEPLTVPELRSAKSPSRNSSAHPHAHTPSPPMAKLAVGTASQ